MTINTATTGVSVFLTLDQIRAIAIDSASAYGQASESADKILAMVENGDLTPEQGKYLTEPTQVSLDLWRAIWTAMTQAYWDETGIDLWKQLGLS